MSAWQVSGCLTTVILRVYSAAGEGLHVRNCTYLILSAPPEKHTLRQVRDYTCLAMNRDWLYAGRYTAHLEVLRPSLQ